MNIIEVKNNLVKLCYEEDLKLSELILIQDTAKAYIGQILHLESTRMGKVAVAKLIFNYNNGISAYDGSVPAIRSEIKPIDTEILLKIIDKNDPLNLGRIAQQEHNLVVNIDVLKDNPIILAEKFFTTRVLLSNIAMQLQSRKEKLVVFDTVGLFKSNKVTITKDFKLPLNTSTINYIYEKGFEDATAESKALIQSIFEELCEYSKTVEFIPFDTFRAVIDSEFMRTRLMQLVILKNKIKQIRDWGVFAQEENEIKALSERLKNSDTTVIDISCLKDTLQKECIKYVYDLLKESGEEYYAFTPLNSENSDKFLLQQINNTENVHTISICGYDYTYVNDLKQRSKNMLMFTPIKQQKDFGGYNIFLQKLAEDEFIAYGKMTKFVPLICKLHKLNASEIYVPKVAEKLAQEVPPVVETAPTVEEVTEPVTIEEVKTEEVIENVATEESEPIAETSAEEIQPVQEPIEDITVEQPVENTTETPTADEENIISEQQTDINETQTTEHSETPIETTEENTEATVSEVTETDEVQEALNNIPDIEDAEELSDDDLDMIESLSKPDEEIEAINTPQVEAVATSVQTEEIQPVQKPEPVIEEPAITEQPEPVVAEPTEPVQPTAEIIPAQTEEIQPVQKPEPVAEPEPVVEEPAITEQPAPVTQEIATENTEAHSVEEEIKEAEIPEQTEGLQTRNNTTSAMPEYSSEIPEEDKINNEVYNEGDRVMHDEFGEGIVEKMIQYGDKTLCSINFASVGKRLLNPEITEMRKI